MSEESQQLSTPLVVGALIIMLIPALIPLYFAIVLEGLVLRLALLGLALTVALFNTGILVVLVRWINALLEEEANTEDSGSGEGEL